MKIQELEKYATENNVPIMERESISYIGEIIKSKNIKNILEIGTAIGYSAINYCLAGEGVKVTSIERDSSRFIEAVKNVKSFNLENRINLVLNDALKTEITTTYDLIVIDAAKAQNINFFERYKKNLNKNGLIITDNIKFHGLVGTEEEIPSKNLRSLVKKIEEYIEYLKEDKEFETVFIDVGDGLAISKRR